MLQNLGIGGLFVSHHHATRTPSTEAQARAPALAVEDNFFFLATAEHVVAAQQPIPHGTLILLDLNVDILTAHLEAISVFDGHLQRLWRRCAGFHVKERAFEADDIGQLRTANFDGASTSRKDEVAHAARGRAVLVRRIQR